MAFILGLALLCLIIIPALVNEWAIHLRDQELTVLVPLEKGLDQAQHAVADIDDELQDYLISGQGKFLLLVPVRLADLRAIITLIQKQARNFDATTQTQTRLFIASINQWLGSYALLLDRQARAGLPLARLRPLSGRDQPLQAEIKSSASMLLSHLTNHELGIRARYSRLTRWSLVGVALLGLVALLCGAYLLHIARLTSALYRRAFEAYQSARGKSLQLESQLSFTQALLRHTPLAIAVLDARTETLRFTNHAFERLPFLKMPEALNQKISDILVADSGTRAFLEAIHSTRESGPNLRFLRDVEVTLSDQSRTFWNFRVVPFGEESEEPPKFLLTLWEDVTSAIIAFENLRHEHEKAARITSELEIILNHMGDGVVVVNRQNEAILVNRQARELLGVPKDLRLPQPLSALPAAVADPLDIRNWARGSTGITAPSRATFLPAASQRLMEVVTTPVFGESHELTSAVGVIHDITAFRKSEQEKDEFLALASHEIKTPLTVLDTACQLIDRAIRARDFRQLELANQYLKAQLRRLKILVLQVFDFANLQADKMKLKLEKADLRELMSRLVDEDRALSTRHRITIELPDHPAPALVDVPRIEQVLNSLISNAIRYSPAGTEIRVELKISDQYLRVFVRDQGIGIPPTDLMRIFRRFSRASNVGNIAGMGIGLYLASEIIQAHKGRMWAESAGQDQGSTFTFELPLAETASLPRARAG